MIFVPEPGLKSNEIPPASKSVSRTFLFMLNTPCILGLTPIYWNGQTNAAKVITNKLLFCRWLITLTLIASIIAYLSAVLINSTIRQGFHPTNMHYLYSLLTTPACFYAFFLHVHAGYRRHELVAYINALIKFWHQNQRLQSSDIYRNKQQYVH